MSAVLASPIHFDSMNSRLPIALSPSGKRDFLPRAAIVARITTGAFVGRSIESQLPAGGWPFGSLVEIFVDDPGIADVALLFPLLAKLTRANRRVAIIAPPFTLDRATLSAAGVSLDRVVQVDADNAEDHWSAEQYLGGGACAAVLQWLPVADYRLLRRLQDAAETSSALAIVFRPVHAIDQVSPAALQLKILCSATSCEIEIVKQRGNRNLQINRWVNASNLASPWQRSSTGTQRPSFA